MSRRWSDDAWVAVAPRYADVLAHPFVVALGDGTLAEEVFARYLLDDAHYLVGYARTLAALAARVPTPDGIALLAEAAAGAITAERGLHRAFLLPRGLDPDAAETGSGPSPTCRAYTGYLAEQAATAPVEVALAAVVPCFRVYAEVGRHVAALAARRQVAAGEHPYAAWVATYADEEFDAVTRRVEALADDLAAATTSGVRDAMTQAYAVATDLEWRFWDQAWTGRA